MFAKFLPWRRNLILIWNFFFFGLLISSISYTYFTLKNRFRSAFTVILSIPASILSFLVILILPRVIKFDFSILMITTIESKFELLVLRQVSILKGKYAIRVENTFELILIRRIVSQSQALIITKRPFLNFSINIFYTWINLISLELLNGNIVNPNFMWGWQIQFIIMLSYTSFRALNGRGGHHSLLNLSHIRQSY